MYIFSKFFFLLYICFSPSLIFASFEIAEVMPNTSDDTNLEYVTLKNLQKSSQSLSGYILQDTSGKSYTFTGIILEGGERKQFFRPQTKIILNNTDETLTLFSQTGAKIDEISYKTSTKDIFLSFEDIVQDDDQQIISQEGFFSRVVHISEEVILPGDTLNNSGAEAPNTPIYTVPEISFLLQRPSYITQSGSGDVYLCDSTQAECKVNFDLSSSFSLAFPLKNYRCEIYFGGELSTGEEQKCNPNTVVFPKGETQVTFRIIHKSNPEIFSERKIQIFFYEYIPVFVANISGSLGGENIKESPRIDIVSPIIELQSGAQGLGTNFFCEKVLCKVNLKYTKHHSLERCYWDFGPGETTSSATRKTCNPGVVTFGPGVHELSLRVYESSRESNEQIVRFFIHNIFDPKLQETEKLQSELQDIIGELSVVMKLQGKLSKEKVLGEKYLSCIGVEKCSVNFEAIVSQKVKKGIKIDYIWKQDDVIFSEKQNPAAFWVYAGKHTILLEVYRDDILISQDSWIVEVIPKEKQIKSPKNPKTLQPEMEEKYLGRDYSGLIFGKILPNPKGNDRQEFIEIKNISSGPLMLGGCIITDSSKKYKLPDEVLAAGASRYFFNPESKISLGNTKDSISLICNDQELENLRYERKMGDDELLSGEIFAGFSLQEIFEIIPSDFQDDYLEKKLSLKFTILKRDGLKIYGTTFPNTKIELFSQDTLYYTLYSDSSGEFLLKTKTLVAGEYMFDVKLSQAEVTYVYPEFKIFSLSQKQRASWFATSIKKVKAPVISKLIVSPKDIDDSQESEQTLSLREKLFFSFLTLTVFLFALGHILYISFPQKNIFLLKRELVYFQTRQKIILLGV